MRTSLITAVGVLAASALTSARGLPAHFKREDDHVDEVVAMVQCKRMKQGDNAPYGTKDQMWWSKDWNAFFAKPKNPEHEAAYVRAPGQGVPTYLNWTAGTVEEPITGDIRGKTFMLYQQAETGDSKTNITGTGSHGGNDFTCYGHMSGITLYEDIAEGWQYVCTPLYACSRSDRMIGRVEVRVSDGVYNVTVDGLSTYSSTLATPNHTPFEKIKEKGKKWAAEMYSMILDAESGGPDAERTHEMGDSDYSMSFEMMRAEHEGDPHYDPERVPNIAKAIIDKLAPALAADMQRDCTVWNGYSDCKWTMGFPSQVTVMYQLAPQRNMRWMNQDIFTIKVIPDGDGDCSTANSLFTMTAGVLAGLSGTAAMYGAALATVAAGGVCFF